MATNPFEAAGFMPAQQAAAAPPQSRLRFVPFPKEATPQTPEERQQTVTSTQKTASDISGSTFRPAKPEEMTAARVDPTLPWQVNGLGKLSLPEGIKPVDATSQVTINPDQARSHVSDILNKIEEANQLLDAPLTSGLPGSIFGHIPGTNAYTLRSLIGDTNDPKNPGMITGDLRQQGISYLRALNGGSGVGTVARSQQEQQALQSAMSNIRQGLPPAALKNALGQVKQIYLRAYARSYGDNPEQPEVQKRYGIDPLWQPQGGVLPGAPQPAAPSQAADLKDHGITASNPPPAIGPSDVSALTASTGDTKAATNPALAAIAPQLEKYLAADPKKVSNAMIIGFMQKSGINPAQTSIMPALQYRMSNEGAAWRQHGGGYSVDPTYSVPLHGLEKTRATISGSPAGAFAAGAADIATYGAVPDAVGLFHDVTGAGPSRSEFIAKRDMLAQSQPGATVAGNLLGGLAPLGGAGEVGALARAGRSAGGGAAYGFLGSDDPNIESRLFNAGEGAVLAGVAHAGTDAAIRPVQAGYRAVSSPVRSLINGAEATADSNALNAAARKMPLQKLDQVRAADAASRAVGVPAPAAASISRSGQDYLARVTSRTPGARAAADSAAQSTARALPQQLADDFNSAILAAGPGGENAATFLNRPARDIAGDIQGIAGREYEKGIAPIADEKLTIDNDLADALTHEQMKGAIADALTSHSLSDTTRQTLRQLPRMLKEADAAVKPSDVPLGAKASEQVAGIQQQVRDQTLKSIPLTVDAARNVATALDRTASRMGDGSEAAIEQRRLAQLIRHKIGDQYPEFAPINARYASRQRAIGALEESRRNFLASTPEGIDALARSGRKFTDVPNEGEFKGVGQPTGNPLPTNRQFAAAGAREAATVKAGENGAATADRLANNVNQQANNATVLGQNGARTVAARAGARANIADTVGRIASGSSGDQTERWFNIVKRGAAMKATGGASHYLLAHAASSIPGLSDDAAARVVRLYLDANSAPQVLQSLTQAYGARKARFMMGRMAAMTAAASGVRGFPVPTK